MHLSDPAILLTLLFRAQFSFALFLSVGEPARPGWAAASRQALRSVQFAVLQQELGAGSHAQVTGL